MNFQGFSKTSENWNKYGRCYRITAYICYEHSDKYTYHHDNICREYL